MTDKELYEVFEANKDRIQRLLDLGILMDAETAKVRSSNAGKSDYSKHLIQPWAIWMEYNLDPWTADVVKRCLRTKEEPGMTRIEARLLDWKKISHISNEMIRQYVIKSKQEKKNNDKLDL